LEAVQQILEGHPEITLLSVEGHTDNRGNANFNRRLSKDRARAVVDWLVARGVDESRLTSMGFGPDQPLQTNDTEEGRQNNRRVEFKIKRRDASKGNQK
jgi:outer membrane protein OmpA-like peptidoglycan-associated protein